MSLLGRSPPCNVTVALDISSPLAGALSLWPKFHNGVAVGLRLQSLRSISPLTARQRKSVCITRTWIVYNKPETPTPQHGGLLLALGLQQQLHVLAMTDIYEYLTLGHDPTTVGILLGMAAAKCGSCDAAVSKMLCLHIPALLPQPFAEMEVSAAAQTAAIAGIGMLYCGTAHRLMAEFLLGEIACCSRGDRMRDREAYTLSAGLALGLVTLGKGSSNEAAGLGDLEIAQRLHHALAGGTGSRSGQISSLLNSTVGQDNYLCEERVCNSRIRDGEYLNTDLTAPGATLALGLYFIQTNSTAAAARLRLPDTGVLIDSVRPDFMLLRVISRGLILWDFIRPTTEWVEAQLPSVLVDSMQALLAVKYSLKSAARSNIFRRCMCRSSRSKMRAKVLFCKCSCKKELPLQDASDWSTIKQAHANIVAGGCFVRMCVTYQQNFSIYL